MIKFCKSILTYLTCKLALLARGNVDDITAKKISKIIVKVLSDGTNRCNYCVGCGYTPSCQEGIYKWLKENNKND